MEHLQQAAGQMIEAARAMLDVAEDLLRDPAPLLGLLAGLAETGRSVVNDTDLEGFERKAEAGSPESPPTRPSNVQHIRVS